MRLATAADIQRIEQICNDPLLRVWTAFDGAPSCRGEQYVEAPSFAIIGDEGCFLFRHMEEARYCLHTNLLPHCRGSAAIRAARESLGIVFLQTDCREMVTMVPDNLPHARIVAGMVGLRYLFHRASVWPAGGQLFGVGFYSFALEDWIATGACADAGAAFHRRLHGELGMPAHAHDPIHDAFVGAVVQMIRAGQVEKAADTYNRFARFAAYEPLRILSREPLRIDIRQCVLRVEGAQFYVEKNHA